MFIKFALEDFQPLTIVALRVSLSALLFLAILLVRKQVLPLTCRFWLHTGVMAILASALPYSLFCFSEQSIDSALAAILTGIAPMFTAILAHLFISSDRLTAPKLLGITLSFMGILLLFAPNLIVGITGSATGMLCATTAALSYGSSHVYAKKYITGQAAFVAPAAQMIICSMIIIPMAWWIESPTEILYASWSSFAGVFGLVIFCTIFAFSIYYRLLEHCGATAVSMVACFFPVGGMLLGFIFLDEVLTPLSLVAALIILTGMMLVNGLISIKTAQTGSQLES